MAVPVIPHFRLFARCGAGSGGEVWACLDPDGIRRAVKIYYPGSPEPAAVRLYRSCGLRHESLIDILYVGSAEGRAYCVTELADHAAEPGRPYLADTLQNRLKNHKIYPKDTLYFMKKIVSGLELLHRAGLAHGDLKPSNLLFIRREPVIADPGLISPLYRNSRCGTAEFHPPAACTAEAADIYALGKILYCMLTGFSPAEFPRIRQCFQGETPRILNRIILRCCDERADRFRSVREIRQILDTIPVGPDAPSRNFRFSGTKIFPGIRKVLAKI